MKSTDAMWFSGEAEPGTKSSPERSSFALSVTVMVCGPVEVSMKFGAKVRLVNFGGEVSLGLDITVRLVGNLMAWRSRVKRVVKFPTRSPRSIEDTLQIPASA